MKLNLAVLRGREGDVPFSYEPDLSAALPGSLSARDALASGRVSRRDGGHTGDGLTMLEGSLTAVLPLVCDRCAEPFERRKTVRVSCAVARSGDAEDDGDVFICDGDELDLDEVFVPALILDMDMKTLCRDDCGGLCPRCGGNLNTGGCRCP